MQHGEHVCAQVTCIPPEVHLMVSDVPLLCSGYGAAGLCLPVLCAGLQRAAPAVVRAPAQVHADQGGWEPLVRATGLLYCCWSEPLVRCTAAGQSHWLVPCTAAGLL